MKRILKALLPLGILGLGVAGAMALFAARTQAEPKEASAPLTFVEIADVERVDHTPTITAMGVVAAEKQVAVSFEVAGRVTEQNAALVPGGKVAAGDPLLRIDARDYALAVDSSKADLAQARLLVREESTLRKVAEHEWRERPQGFSDETLAFALREPHIDAAKARVKSAQNQIKKAKRDLGRTILRAPFDAMVLAESVDVGQAVAPGVALATLAGIDRFWVQVSLPVRQLTQLQIPEVNTDAPKGSVAKVHNEASGTDATRDGYVLRLEGTVDPRGRMAQLFVGVDDPLGIKQPIAERPIPLLLGTKVRVEFAGKTLHDVVVLPRRALRHDSSVWTVDAEGRLHARPVEVVWRERGIVVIENGLTPGDRVVLTRLPIATEGMQVSLETTLADDEG